ncbi:hypothetical protein PsorP6_012442 [Peronosclerospora sorghi]|uniref:Uncharacterized protein n=1 Tax=Peronosclerospora sorghi TaxID=230839 RepID=A0ACC0WJ81_9STRA|nr:hypothetical protein PsorP6_012442 [Peronosclerospora sorghi]
MASSGEICSFFFEPVRDPNAPAPVATAPASPCSSESLKKRGRKKTMSLGGANRHRCKLCHKVYTQAASTGYTNLLTHLRIKHRDWEDRIKSEVPVAPSEGEGVMELPTPVPLPSSAPVRDDTERGPKMKRLVGRRRGLVYEHFDDMPSTPGHKYKKMRCRYCHGDTPQLSGRMKFHLGAKCPRVPDDVKAHFATAGPKLSVKVESVVKTDVATTGTLPPSTAVKPVAVTPEGSSAAVAPSSPAHSTLQSRKQQDVFDVLLFEEKLTAALVIAHAPWALLDTPEFRAAMDLVHPASDLRPAPLTATRARTNVLSRLALKYDRECTDVLARSTAVTLVVTNVEESGTKGTKKATYVAVTESRRAFVLAQSSDTTIVPYVTTILSVLSKVQATSPRAHLFLCTPTSGAFANARRELLRTTLAPDKPLVLMGACMTQQTAVLLLELVTNSMSLEAAFHNAVLAADALHVMPSLRQHVVRGIDATQTQGEPGTYAFAHVSVTSWRSMALAVKQALRLKPFLQQAVADEKEASLASSTLRSQLINCDMAWTTLRHTDQLLAPLCFLSALSEVPATTSGQLLALWIWLFGVSTRSPLFDGYLDRLIANFMQRLECYVEEHFVACLVLDPRVHGAGLSVSGLRRARGITVSVAAALVPDFHEDKFIRSYNDYMKQQEDFGDSSVWNAANTANPITFWSDYEGDRLHAQLALVGKLVCSYVPHTCSFEEMWSAHARRKATVHVAVSDEHEQCAKVRYGAALEARPSVQAIVRTFEPLLELDDDVSVADRLRQATAAPRDAKETEPTLSVRSVLESIPDGIDEDAAKFEAPGSVLDASCFDMSSAGLDKIRAAMTACLKAACEQC